MHSGCADRLRHSGASCGSPPKQQHHGGVAQSTRHFEHNCIFDEPDGVKRVKFDGVTGEIHCAQFDFSTTDYAFSTVIGYSVTAGNFQFGGLEAGTYVVRENDPSEDFQSTNDADGGFDEDSWNSTQVVLEAGQHIADRDFLDEPFATGTLAFIINVKTLDGDDERVVEWTTGAEAGTVGSLLYGIHPETRQLVKINSTLLATAGAPAGGIYRVRDEEPGAKQFDEYIIEEVEDDGNVRRYGPFEAEETDMNADWLGARARPMDDPSISPSRSETPARSGDFLNLLVAEAGVYHVSAARIGAGLGWTEEQTREAILDANVRVRHRGRSS
ncbi:MAG: hypothetical protein ACOC0L_01250 [bacterium]